MAGIIDTKSTITTTTARGTATRPPSRISPMRTGTTLAATATTTAHTHKSTTKKSPTPHMKHALPCATTTCTMV